MTLLTSRTSRAGLCLTDLNDFPDPCHALGPQPRCESHWLSVNWTSPAPSFLLPLPKAASHSEKAHLTGSFNGACRPVAYRVKGLWMTWQAFGVHLFDQRELAPSSCLTLGGGGPSQRAFLLGHGICQPIPHSSPAPPLLSERFPELSSNPFPKPEGPIDVCLSVCFHLRCSSSPTHSAARPWQPSAPLANPMRVRATPTRQPPKARDTIRTMETIRQWCVKTQRVCHRSTSPSTS